MDNETLAISLSLPYYLIFSVLTQYVPTKIKHCLNFQRLIKVYPNHTNNELEIYYTKSIQQVDDHGIVSESFFNVINID